MTPKLKNHSTWQSIDPQSIVCLRAESNYTFLYLANGQKILFAIGLKELEKRLSSIDTTYYLRVHKSALINTQFITHVNLNDEEPSITLKNRYQVTVSRRKRTTIRKQIKCLALNKMNRQTTFNSFFL